MRSRHRKLLVERAPFMRYGSQPLNAEPTQVNCLPASLQVDTDVIPPSLRGDLGLQKIDRSCDVVHRRRRILLQSRGGYQSLAVDLLKSQARVGDWCGYPATRLDLL